MSITFTNLQIQAPIETIPKGLIPKRYVCMQTSKNWTALFECDGSYLWEELYSLGRRISKQICVPVIAVGFFDEDEFEMTLLIEGKIMAIYHTGVSGKECKSSVKWIEGLGLPEEEAAAFQYLARKQMSAYESIRIFSKLLGIRFFSDIRMAPEQYKAWNGDAQEAVREINEEKKGLKVKGKTEARLLQEIPGMFVAGDERRGILQAVYPDGFGDFSYNWIHCLEIREDGLFEIHNFHYPEAIFKENSRHVWKDYVHEAIHVMGKDIPICYEKYDLHEYEDELDALMEIPEENIMRREDSPQIIAVHTGRVIDEGQYEYYERGKMHKKKDELRKADIEPSGKRYSEKNIVAFYEYEDPDFENAFWDSSERIPILTKDGVLNVRLQYIKNPENIICDARFFNKDLKLLRRSEVRLNEEFRDFLGNFKYAYCEETDCIYMGNKKIDLKNHRTTTGMKELKRADRLFVHYDAKNTGFLYAVRNNYVYILDLNLKLLSCHILKGKILYFFVNKRGNVCLVTVMDQTWEEKVPDKNSALRLYEIAEKEGVPGSGKERGNL